MTITISSDFFVNSSRAYKRSLSEADAWLDLVLNACQQDDNVIIRRHHSIQRRRGQVVASLRELADRWRWDINVVRTMLRHWTSLRQITVDSTSITTIITIVNYGDFCVSHTQSHTDNDLNDNELEADCTHNHTQCGDESHTQPHTDKGLENSELTEKATQNHTQCVEKGYTEQHTDNALKTNNLQDVNTQNPTQSPLRNSTRVNTSVFISTEDKSSVDDLQETPGANETFVVDITSDSRRRMTKAEAKAVVDYYNEKAGGCSLPKVKMLTIKRQASINARCCEHGRRTLLTAIDKAVMRKCRVYDAQMPYLRYANAVFEMSEGHQRFSVPQTLSIANRIVTGCEHTFYDAQARHLCMRNTMFMVQNAFFISISLTIHHILPHFIKDLNIFAA